MTYRVGVSRRQAELEQRAETDPRYRELVDCPRCDASGEIAVKSEAEYGDDAEYVICPVCFGGEQIMRWHAESLSRRR